MQLEPGRGAPGRAPPASSSRHALNPAAGTRVGTHMCRRGHTHAPGARSEGWGPCRAETRPPGDGEAASCFSGAQAFLSDSELPCQVL